MAYLYDDQGKMIGHILRQQEAPAACPVADDQCPDCRVDLEIEYGFSRYGLGAFNRCPKCYKVFNFSEDTE